MKPFTQMFPRKLSSYAKLPFYCAKQVFSKRFSLHALKGPEINSGLPINILYLGEGHTLEYLKTLFFRSVTHESLIEQYSLLDAIRGIGALPKGYDLRICEFTPRILNFIPKKSSFQIPEWIEQEISLTGSWKDVIGHFRRDARKNELRLVRKYNYEYDVVTDPAAIKYFYHELYLPYAEKRFQKAVEIVDDEWLISVAEKGGLLRILDKDQVIAGAVFYRQEQFLDGIWLGALMQNGQNLIKGAFSSLYYHSIEYAHNEGFPRIKLGGSRSFLTDGVYRFKRKWGAQIVSARHNDTALFIDFNFNSQACRQWLESSTFITEHSKEFYANFFVFDESANNEQLINRIENHISPGLSGINVYSSSRLNSLPASIGSCQIHNLDINDKLRVDNT
jgi:hypothetical protein